LGYLSYAKASDNKLLVYSLSTDHGLKKSILPTFLRKLRPTGFITLILNVLTGSFWLLTHSDPLTHCFGVTKVWSA